MSDNYFDKYETVNTSNPNDPIMKEMNRIASLAEGGLFSDMAYTRRKRVEERPPGTFTIARNYDVQPEGAAFDELHRGNETVTTGLIVGQLFDLYHEGILSPSSQALKKFRTEGGMPPRNYRVPTEHIPEGVVMFSPMTRLFYRKHMADGSVLEDEFGNAVKDRNGNPVKKPIAFYDKHEAEKYVQYAKQYKHHKDKTEMQGTNQFLPYWEVIKIDDGNRDDVKRLGMVHTQMIKDHIRKYGRRNKDADDFHNFTNDQVQAFKKDFSFIQNGKNTLRNIDLERDKLEPNEEGEYPKWVSPKPGFSEADLDKEYAKQYWYKTDDGYYYTYGMAGDNSPNEFGLNKDDNDRIRVVFSSNGDFARIERMEHHLYKDGKMTVHSQSRGNPYPLINQRDVSVYTVDPETLEIKQEKWLWKSGLPTRAHQRFTVPALNVKDSEAQNSQTAWTSQIAPALSWLYKAPREEGANLVGAFNDWGVTRNKSGMLKRSLGWILKPLGMAQEKQKPTEQVVAELKRLSETWSQVKAEPGSDDDIAKKFSKIYFEGKHFKGQMINDLTQKELFQGLKAIYDELPGSAQEKAKQLREDFLTPLWHHPKNAKQSLYFYGQLSKNAQPPRSVDRNGEMTGVYLGKDIREYHTATGLELYWHSTLEKTWSPIGGSMSGSSGKAGSGNRPAYGKWDMWYFVDEVMQEYISSFLPKTDSLPGTVKIPGLNPKNPLKIDEEWRGKDGFSNTAAHKKAQKIIGYIYSKDIGTVRDRDGLPDLTAVGAMAKANREFWLGLENMAEGAFNFFGASTAVTAAVGTAAALLTPLGGMGAIGLAGAAAVGAIPGFFAGTTAYNQFAQKRFEKLTNFERLTDQDVKRMYDPNTRESKGMFGLGAFKEDYALFMRGLRSRTFIWMEDQDKAITMKNTATALLIAGATALTGGLAGLGVMAFSGGLGAGLTAASVAATAIGGATTLAGSGANTVSNLGRKGYYHFLADYFINFPKPTEANKQAYSANITDAFSRVRGWNFIRDMEGNEKFIEEIVALDKKYNDQIGLQTSTLRNMKELQIESAKANAKERYKQSEPEAQLAPSSLSAQRMREVASRADPHLTS